MPASARNIEPEEIPEPSLSLRDREVVWGDEFKAAFTQAKHHFGDIITYDAVAHRVSKLVPVSSTSILRLGYMDHPPTRPNQRQIAYLALVAMGFDPLEFGLKRKDRALRGMTDIEIRKMLDPGHGTKPREEPDWVEQERAVRPAKPGERRPI